MPAIPNGIRVRDRHGETVDFIRQGVVSAEQIGSALKPLLNKGAMLCTDDALAYKLITKQVRESHQYFCRPADCK